MTDRFWYPQARVTMSLVPASRPNDLITIGDIQPRSMTYRSTPENKVDTLELDLQADLFPADPRLFSSVAAAAYLGTVNGPEEALPSVDEHLMFLGNADHVMKSWSLDGSAVKLKFRDYKAILLDQKWERRRISRGQTLAAMTSDLLATIPAVSDLAVVLESDGFDPLIPARVKGRKGKTWRAKEDTPVFDALYDLATQHGATVTVRGDLVTIGRPRTLDERFTAVPFFVTGENLVSLELERKFGTAELPNVRVVAYDADTNTTVTGQYPTVPNVVRRITRSKSKTSVDKQTVIHTFNVTINQPTEARLKQIAQVIFEKFAQQQVTIRFETKDLTVREHIISKGRQDAGLEARVTQIRNGHPVRLHVGPDSRNILSAEITEAAKRQALVRQEYDRRVAQVLAEGWRDIDTTFFVDEAEHSFTVDGGYTLKGTAKAFLTVNAEDLF